MRWLTLLPLALGGAFLAGCAAPSEAAGDAEQGRAYVEKTCSGCHPGGKLDEKLAPWKGREDPGAALERFLANHHAADPARRGDAIAHLLQRIDAE